MSTTAEEIKTTYMDSKRALESLKRGEWPPEDDIGVLCCICGKPINDEDYSGKLLGEEHTVNLVIMASAGDASLPHALEAHGSCLPELTAQLREKNKDWRWI